MNSTMCRKEIIKTCGGGKRIHVDKSYRYVRYYVLYVNVNNKFKKTDKKNINYELIPCIIDE